MTFSGDPLRTLGLPAGASADEIKRAYRALAKRYHPDSAGEAALSRFLAIQAAYDMLTAPDTRTRNGPAGPTQGPTPPARGARPRPAGTRGSPNSDPGSTGPGADTDRTRATRDAFRNRRTRPGPTSGPMGGPAWWAAGRQGTAGPDAAGAGSSAGAGAGTTSAGAGARDDAGAGARDDAGAGARDDAGAGARDDAGAGARDDAGADVPPHSGSAGGRHGPASGGRSTAGGSARRRRDPKVATLGSTSYDDAPRDPEPAWNGATWYGDTSGTYWTINPKEYADPRKHGPEYLARARRGSASPDAGGPAPAGDPTEPPADPPDSTGAAFTGQPDASAGPRPDPRPTARTEAPRSPSPDTPAADGAPAPTADPFPPFRASRRARTATWTTAAAAAGTRTGSSGPATRVASDTPADPPPDRDTDALAGPFDAGISQRIILALIAWPPLGLALSLLIGEATGCGRYAASCSEPASLLGWIVQPAVVGLLVLLPVVARPAAVASVAVGIAALGGGAVISALGGARAPGIASNLLLAILVMAWAVGLIGAIAGRLPLPRWLRVPADPD